MDTVQKGSQRAKTEGCGGRDFLLGPYNLGLDLGLQIYDEAIVAICT